jgi:hypothetical protein
MYAAVVALLFVWTGPHTPCVWARPYDGEPAVVELGLKRKIGLFAEGGVLEQGPDRQSATVCAAPAGERAA